MHSQHNIGKGFVEKVLWCSFSYDTIWIHETMGKQTETFDDSSVDPAFDYCEKALEVVNNGHCH